MQALAIQTLATTEEHVRSVRPTGATPSLVTSASVHQASVEFTANTVSWTILFCASLKNLETLDNDNDHKIEHQIKDFVRLWKPFHEI